MCENKFKDCLFIKLHSQSRSAGWFLQLKKFFSFQSQKNLTEQIVLRLTIRFGEQEIPVKFGTIKFGLRGGELKLNLTNCKIPLENLEFTPKLLANIEIEEQKENSKATENTAILTLRGGATRKRSKANKESFKLKDEVYQVYTKGTEESPIWVFQIQTNKEIFIGGWKKEKIGIAEVNAKPYTVEAIFEVQDEDIRLTSATGIWSKNIGRNKIAWIQREYLLRCVRPQLQPYISLARLSYG